MPVSGLPPYDDQNVFARILRGEIPSRRVYEDEWAIAFHDIAPQAPVHVLFVPKTTIPTLDAARPEHAELLGRLLLAAAEYALREAMAGQSARPETTTRRYYVREQRSFTGLIRENFSYSGSTARATRSGPRR